MLLAVPWAWRHLRGVWGLGELLRGAALGKSCSDSGGAGVGVPGGGESWKTEACSFIHPLVPHKHQCQPQLTSPYTWGGESRDPGISRQEKGDPLSLLLRMG